VCNSSDLSIPTGKHVCGEARVDFDYIINAVASLQMTACMKGSLIEETIDLSRRHGLFVYFVSTNERAFR